MVNGPAETSQLIFDIAFCIFRDFCNQPSGAPENKGVRSVLRFECFPVFQLRISHSHSQPGSWKLETRNSKQALKPGTADDLHGINGQSECQLTSSKTPLPLPGSSRFESSQQSRHSRPSFAKIHAVKPELRS